MPNYILGVESDKHSFLIVGYKNSPGSVENYRSRAAWINAQKNVHDAHFSVHGI